MRFGLSERRSRSRMSTRTVWTKPGGSKSRRPAAYPARVEHERVDGFTIAHAAVALKDHDDGHDARRDGAAPGTREEIDERFVGKKLVGARGEKRKKSSSPASATRRARGSNGRDPRAWVLGRRSCSLRQSGARNCFHLSPSSRFFSPSCGARFAKAMRGRIVSSADERAYGSATVKTTKSGV
jgi:hypothetical protein